MGRNFDSVLREAIQLHREGDGEGAERRYLALLEVTPEQPDALHYLGVLRYQQGRPGEAIELILRALRAVPDFVDAWNNLGNVLREAGRVAEAKAAYVRVLQLDDCHAGAWNNLALVLSAEGLYPEALAGHRRAIELAPEVADPYYNYGNTLRGYGEPDEALAAYRQTLALDPAHTGANTQLGHLLCLTGRRDDAVAHFRDWVAADPRNPVARHLLAAYSGEDTPPRASDEYVRSTFDRFADGFDVQLLTRLGYRAPGLVGTALSTALGAPAGNLDILDAGCGTGLCAEHLRPFARTLTGVDLSSGMLRKALAHGGYDGLYEGELTAFLMDRPAHWDVIASADTLVYFGALEAVAAAAQGALKPGGWLVFTAERYDGPHPYRLADHGRYGHSDGYLRSVLSEAGLERIEIEPAVLRHEGGHEVSGFVVRAGKPGPSDYWRSEGETL